MFRLPVIDTEAKPGIQNKPSSVKLAKAAKAANMHETLEKIAREIGDIETLETRKWDRLDFSEHACWTIKAMLEAAYYAGQNSVK